MNYRPIYRYANKVLKLSLELEGILFEIVGVIKFIKYFVAIVIFRNRKDINILNF